MDKKKKRKMDDDRADIGMVMTVSLFLILLTFFILLNSIAVIDEHRSRVAIGSLIGAFGGLPGGLSPLKTGKNIMPPSAPMVDEELTLEQLLSCMNKETTAWPGDIIVKKAGDKLIITINEKVLFNGERSEFKPSILPVLDKLCGIINKGNYPVEIVGHTDNIQAREKGYESNWELSLLMAIQLAKYFMSKGAVSPKRLNPCGSGSFKPTSSNDSRQSRSKNRRVEIILNYKAPNYIKRVFRKKPSGFFTYKKFDFKIF
ncbi:MAG: OmpA family protein [Thermodesulfobacteriota bacterium]|nr:OmpA family protein [Thermodesulfobacteriota bacterium]